MTRIDGAILIERPPEVVFDFVADERNEPRYNPRLHQVQKLTAGPVGTGTRFAAVTGARATPLTIEFTDYDRPRRLASSTSMAGMDIDGCLTFMAVDGGTWLRWSWQLRPHGAARLLGPLIARMGRRQERAIWSALKDLMEREDQPTAPERARLAHAGSAPGQR